VQRALKVACFIPSFPELSETFILRQIVGLLDRGHDVRIFAHDAAEGGRSHPEVERHQLLRRTRVIGGDAPAAPAERMGRVALGAFLRCLHPETARAAGGWGALVRTLSALRGEGPFDVVHCHYGVAGLRYGLAARLWGAPLVVSFYGYDVSQYPRERGERVYQPLFANAQRVLSLSERMDAQLRALGCAPELLRRVPLSVDPADDTGAARAARDGNTPPRLLTVARLVEKKGIAVALHAIAQLRDEGTEVRYDVIGDGPLRAELEALAKSLGIADRVHFPGAAPNARVRQAMGEADLFVLPSMTASNGDEEGTPTVLLEAADARLPVLATRHAGIPEIVADGESGVLVREGDPIALAEGLRTLLAARHRWPAMGEAGRRLVIERGHRTADVAARLERLYLELLPERAR
jgi:colanic acid/amylovoran biosynthesis glycosyltransferase